MRKNLKLSDICYNAYTKPNNLEQADKENDFVGLQFHGTKEDRLPSVTFPLGYRLGNDENSLRRDILILLTALRRSLSTEEGSMNGANYNDDRCSLSPYQRIILDFLNNGYYTEREVNYKKKLSGKINWTRTIKRVRPIFQDNQAIYLNFITRNIVINEDALLTQIHKYCVYISFQLLGWLYTDFMPQKPEIMEPNLKYYLSIVKKKIQITFNNQIRALLKDMEFILSDDELNILGKNIKDLGTYNFEYPWQTMVSTVFTHYDSICIKKDDFYPHGHWIINNRDVPIDKRALQPDTVMIKEINGNVKVYILDAKYYKYFIKHSALPDTDSIQKQITYGDYAHNTKKYENVYNAFLIPYDLGEKRTLESIGYAYSDWQGQDSKDASYKKIYAILVDTKWLLKTYLQGDSITGQKELSDKIDEAVKKYQDRSY